MDRIAIVFANTGDDDLGALTLERSIASIPFGGRYRLIDFMLSNLVNAGVEKVAVTTRGNYQSLMDHLGAGREWDLDKRTGGLYFLPPFAHHLSGRMSTKIEGLQSARYFLARSQEKYVFLCEPDLICNVDLDAMVARHEQTGADITILTKCSSELMHPEYKRFRGVSDASGRLVSFGEYTGVSGDQHVSSGVYLLTRELLNKIIADCTAEGCTDFEHDIIAGKCGELKIMPYNVPHYGAKISNIHQYYVASMELLDANVRHDLFFGGGGRIYTKTHDDVPVLYGLESNIGNSLIADGSYLDGAIENSIIFRRVHAEKGAVVRNSIVMQDCRIGANAVVEYAIIDKNAVISDGAVVRGTANDPIVIAKDARV